MWGCSSVVERMLCMYEAPGSIPGISTLAELRFQLTSHCLILVRINIEAYIMESFKVKCIELWGKYSSKPLHPCLIRIVAPIYQEKLLLNNIYHTKDISTGRVNSQGRLEHFFNYGSWFWREKSYIHKLVFHICSTLVVLLVDQKSLLRFYDVFFFIPLFHSDYWHDQIL